MESGYLRKQAEAKIVDLFKNEEKEDWSLGELVRKGVRLMLETALEMEVEEFLGCARYERSEGKRKGYRNGVSVRRVKTLGGEVEIRKPKVRDTEEPFRSQILRAWQRRCDELSELIPGLYLEGVSTRDFQRVLGTFWGETGFSKSTISRLNKRLHEEFEAWRRRDLSKEGLVFLYLDALFAGVRYGTSEKEAVMIAHGIREDGSRSVLSVRFGGRESTANWAEVLHDLEARNLPRPLLVISDGNAGLIRAIEDTWPGIARQRCVHHRRGNILEKVPKGVQEEVGKALNAIWNADTLKDAKAAARCFVKQYGRRYESATECLLECLPECLTFYTFPEKYWKRIRTSNLLERTFKEVRRRTRVVGRFPTERSALAVIYGILTIESAKWRGLKFDPTSIIDFREAVEQLKANPIRIDLDEEAA